MLAQQGSMFGSARGERAGSAVAKLRTRLDEIRPGAHIRHLFEALQALTPLDACVVQSFRDGPPHHIVFASYQLPNSVADAWLTDTEGHFSMTLAPLMFAPPGTFLSAAQDTTEQVQSAVPVYAAMAAAGLRQSSALVLPKRTVAGADEHRFVALLSRSTAPISPKVVDILSSAHVDISRAANNIILPRSAVGAMFTRYIEDRRIGYACVDGAGAVTMSNARAHDLAVQYSKVSAATSFTTLEDLVTRARYHHLNTGRDYLRYNPSLNALLRVSVHRLCVEGRESVEPEGQQRADLVMLEEVTWDPVAYEPPRLRKADLTPRQRETAIYLYSGNLTAKEIAERLGIATRTVQTHTRAIYKKFGVRSRNELQRELSRSEDD